MAGFQHYDKKWQLLRRNERETASPLHAYDPTFYICCLLSSRSHKCDQIRERGDNNRMMRPEMRQRETGPSYRWTEKQMKRLYIMLLSPKPNKRELRTKRRANTRAFDTRSTNYRPTILLYSFIWLVPNMILCGEDNNGCRSISMHMHLDAAAIIAVSCCPIIYLNTLATAIQSSRLLYIVCSSVPSATPISRRRNISYLPATYETPQCSRWTAPPTTEEANDLQPAREHLARLSQCPFFQTGNSDARAKPTQQVLSCPLLLSHIIPSTKHTSACFS